MPCYTSPLEQHPPSNKMHDRSLDGPTAPGSMGLNSFLSL